MSPAKSQKQQKMMGMALGMKRGKMPMKGHAGKMAKEMTEKQLKEYAGTKRKGLPKKVKKKKK